MIIITFLYFRAESTLATLGKRAPALSVNADLQNLADNVYGSRGSSGKDKEF